MKVLKFYKKNFPLQRKPSEVILGFGAKSRVFLNWYFFSSKQKGKFTRLIKILIDIRISTPTKSVTLLKHYFEQYKTFPLSAFLHSLKTCVKMLYLCEQPALIWKFIPKKKEMFGQLFLRTHLQITKKSLKFGPNSRHKSCTRLFFFHNHHGLDSNQRAILHSHDFLYFKISSA